MIIRLSGEPGVPHDLSDTARYSTLDEALHAVFLRRLAEIGLTAGPGGPREPALSRRVHRPLDADRGRRAWR